MFEDVPVYRMLEYLDREVAFISDDDRNLLSGYKLTLDTGGGPLSPQQVAYIVRIYRFVAGQRSIMDDLPPLTARKMLDDLAGKADLMLSQPEADFCKLARQRLDRGGKLDEREMQALLQIYTDKGF